MYNLSLEWITGKEKGKQIAEFINGELHGWRKNCGLNEEKKYSKFACCYGNPDAEIVFVAEIPNLKRLEQFPDDDKIWMTSWKASKGDKRFRKALFRNKFIPRKDVNIKPELKDNLRRWRCWLTNFVKCPEYVSRWNPKEDKKKRWKRLSTEEKTEILKQSAVLLWKELKIINPKMIILMGDSVQSYFNDYVISSIVPTAKIYHYSMRGGRESERKYCERFNMVIKWYRRNIDSM